MYLGKARCSMLRVLKAKRNFSSNTTLETIFFYFLDANNAVIAQLLFLKKVNTLNLITNFFVLTM